MTTRHVKATISLILAVLIGFAIAAPAHADNQDVQDQAGILNAATQEYVLKQNDTTLKKVKGSPQLAFVTRKNISNTSVEQYARDLAEQYGIGHKGWDNGILFLIVTDTHKVRMQTGRGVVKVIPDSFLEKNIIPTVRPFLKQGDYNNAVRHITDIVCKQLSAHQNELPTPQDMAKQEERADMSGPIVAAIIFGALGLFAIYCFKERTPETLISRENALHAESGWHPTTSSPHSDHAQSQSDRDGFAEGVIIGAAMGAAHASNHHATHHSTSNYTPPSDFGGFDGGFDGGGGATSSW